MTIVQKEKQLSVLLTGIYDEREASNIADRVMENITGWKKLDRIINKMKALSTEQESAMEKYEGQLLNHMPVQYVLHEAWFCGLKFYVDESTLIPRPETEELVQWLVSEFSALPKKTDYPVRILEVGTGSGCIPITLKKKLLSVELTSCDVSKAALHVAKKNSSTFETAINYLHLDFLNRKEWARIPRVDCIISNPPYVCTIEKGTMSPNVLRYEPEQALFVADQDPLIFYRAIADFGKEKLENSGRIYVEINENLAREIASLFSARGYSEIEIRMDMQGKQRMIKATWLP